MLETGLGTTSRYVLAILLILALVGLVAWLLRQFSAARQALSGTARGRQPRLAVLDHTVIDARRKLVLIRRDNVEHLILIGGPTDVVVEMNIVRAMPLAPLARPVRDDGGEPTLTPAEPFELDRPSRPEPRIQRTDPQYLEMAKKLEAAMTKPGLEPELPIQKTEAPKVEAPKIEMPRVEMPKVEMPKVEPRPAPVEPRLATPPEPKVAPEPKIVAPEPIVPPRLAERAERIEPRPAPAPEPKQKEKTPDPFVSLEEEMASLLRPGGRPQ
jgi:hypothetical protein